MGIIEWVNSFGSIFFSDTHCDELEKKSTSLLKNMETLLAQADADALLFLEEKKRYEGVHKTLDELAQEAKKIEETTASILPEIVLREAMYATHLQEIQRIATLVLVPNEVTNLKKELNKSLQGLEVAWNELNIAVQTFKKRGV